MISVALLLFPGLGLALLGCKTVAEFSQCVIHLGLHISQGVRRLAIDAVRKRVTLQTVSMKTTFL